MGIEEVLQLEIHRARWRRERAAFSLVNPGEEGFVLGRLPLPGTEPLVRMLVLPADPEAEKLALDDFFWDWFTGDLPDPASGRPAGWGSRNRPTSGTALRYQPYGDECYRYLAVHRSGALEMGPGRDAGSAAEPVADVGSGEQVVDRGARGSLRLTTTVGRTMGGGRIDQPSPDLLDTLYLCQQRQEWYRDYARMTGEGALDFVGSVSTASDAETAAADLRRALSFDLDGRRRASRRTDAMRAFIEQADSLGVLVMISGIVGNNTHRRLDPEEFRGFALSDDLAPLVFINGADTKAAQMLTLAHESGSSAPSFPCGLLTKTS